MINNLPTVVALPFSDGVHEVSEHIADLFKAHQIQTYTMTYEEAIKRLDWANANNAVEQAFDKIIGNHLRNFG